MVRSKKLWRYVVSPDQTERIPQLLKWTLSSWLPVNTRQMWSVVGSFPRARTTSPSETLAAGPHVLQLQASDSTGVTSSATRGIAVLPASQIPPPSVSLTALR